MVEGLAVWKSAFSEIVRARRHNIVIFFVCFAALVVLYVGGYSNYLLIHSISEVFGVVVAMAIFVLVWNLKQYLSSNYLVFLGIAYLFVGAIDLLHTFAYKGMGVFQDGGSNLATQLWVSSRYLQSISFLVASYFAERKLKANIQILVYTAITCILLSSISIWQIFPTCFVEGVGLTPFKKISEYIISGILVVALIALLRKRHVFEKSILWLFAASIVVTILSEMASTLYIDVYGIANFAGHLLKIFSFYLVLTAVAEIGIRQPFALFLRDMKKKDDALLAEKETLEETVNARTENLEEAIQELRNSERRYRTVADFAYYWEWWQDPDGRFNYVSPSCERITGYKQEEFIENPSLVRDIVIPDDKHIWDGHRHDVQSDEHVLREVQLRVMKKDGSTIWIEHSCQPVEDDGSFLGFRACNRDISESKNAQEELNLLRTELTHVTRMTTMGELSAALAHELNQPLTAILSNAQAAQRYISREEPDLKEVREILADIVSDDDRAKNIILKMRSVMKKEELSLVRLNINQVIREIMPLVHSHALIRDVTLATRLTWSISPILGDRTQLHQVILNLILNAIDAMADADLKELSVSTTQNGADTVIVSVKDLGTGIDEENIEKLFAPFHTTKKEGMGMGLTICRSIIEAHNGKMWATNNPDKGATFYFSLAVDREVR